MKAEGEEQGSQRVALLYYFLLLGILRAPNKTKLSSEQHRSQYLVNPGATRQTSHRKQDLSIWLKAFSRSMVKRHRSLSLCHCLMAWKMTSQPLGVPNTDRAGGGIVSCSRKQQTARISL